MRSLLWWIGVALVLTAAWAANRAVIFLTGQDVVYIFGAVAAVTAVGWVGVRFARFLK